MHKIILNFTEKIKSSLIEEEGAEEEISLESWAKEETKGKKLNKPFRTPGGPKKFSVYVKNEKGNVVKVNFGDPNMEIKRDSPERRKSFRARHNCSNPGPKTKARYWSCKMWSQKSVTNVTKGNEILHELDESDAELNKKQKTLPPEIQKKILDKKNKESGKKNNKDSDKEGKKEPKEKSEAESKGLWHNIREKKKRMGKNYRPAKPGDKDYPDPKALKKAQKKKEDKK